MAEHATDEAVIAQGAEDQQVMEWFTETLHPNWTQQIRVKEVLYRDKTEHQDLILFESHEWGRVLALDGVIQTTTRDEFIYHEMLVHPALLAHPEARHVCIVGGGDGGSAREVLKHKHIERVTQIEIDEGVIDFCKRYLPSLSAGAFDDPRVDLVFADAAREMERTRQLFDVIIIDSTDPIGPGAALFTEKFYRACHARLANSGIMVSQCGNSFISPQELVEALSRQRAAGFRDVNCLSAVVPTYIGGVMSLGWASDEPLYGSITLDELHTRSLPTDLRYYTPETHLAAFAHPRWLKELVDQSRGS